METGTSLAWVVILAGGDGTRLRSLTAHIVGDARPKQFCPIVDGETLLDRTRHRAELLVGRDRQVIAVTRAHTAYYGYLLDELSPDRLVVQPVNRGTGPGILYPLLRVEGLAGDVPVAVLPSDHYVSDEARFMGYVQGAIEAVQARRDLVILLGVEAESPETDYGWIEPEREPLPLGGEPVFRIRRFWEKPSLRVAERLLAVGGFWNSFVMVGRVSAFLSLIRATVPQLVARFEPVRRSLGSATEAAVVDRVYRHMPPVCFSARVLAVAPRNLATIAIKGVEWSDWGDPARVVRSLRRSGRYAAWFSHVESAAPGARRVGEG